MQLPPSHLVARPSEPRPSCQQGLGQWPLVPFSSRAQGGSHHCSHCALRLDPDKRFRGWRKIGSAFLGTEKPQPHIVLTIHPAFVLTEEKNSYCFQALFPGPLFLSGGFQSSRLTRESHRPEFQGSQPSSVCHRPACQGSPLTLLWGSHFCLLGCKNRKNMKSLRLVENAKYLTFVIIRVSKLFTLSMESWLNDPQ